MRALVTHVPLLLALMGTAATARAQESAVRFAITGSGDSTFTFAVDGKRWVTPGLSGIAVDPLRRDALVARFRVLWVKAGEATALITGATTRVEREHMALLTRPAPPFYRQPLFWMGAVVGATVGAIIHH